MGGICDLSTKYIVNGRREFWISKRPREQIADLISAINKIGNEALAMNFYARVAFLQELGCDFIKYNRIAKPVLWMLQQQNDFDKFLPSLHKATYPTPSYIPSCKSDGALYNQRCIRSPQDLTFLAV